MKLKRNISAAVMALSLVAGVAFAANSVDNQGGDVTAPGYGMMYGQGPHHGMYKQGKGMRGRGGQACFMNNGGSGMRGGRMMDPALLEKRNQFLDATVDLRKQIHDKQFSYREASRNASLTLGELQAQEKELFSMRQQLQTERQKFLPVEQ